MKRFIDRSKEVAKDSKALKQRIEDLTEERKKAEAALSIMGRLRTGYSPSVRGSDACCTLFITSYQVDADDNLISVHCLVAEELLVKRRWHKPVPIPDNPGADRMTPVDVYPSEVAETIIERYEEGRVAKGSITKALSEACPCGGHAILVLSHVIDMDYDVQEMVIESFCPECLTIKPMSETHVCDRESTSSPMPLR